MNQLGKWAEQWQKQISDPKRRLQLFFLGLIIIYIVWMLLLLDPVQKSKRLLTDQIQMLQAQRISTQQQIDTLKQTIKTQTFSSLLAVQKHLATSIQNLQQQLGKTHPTLITADDWLKLKKSIITQQDDIDQRITLISMHDHPLEPWVPVEVDKADMATVTVSDIYQHVLEVEFQADYFSTILYLSRLEKLPWHVYWDSLQYKVLAYPKADVIIKLRVFTQEKDE